LKFRDATESDVAAIVACCDGRNALPLSPRLRDGLPALLRQLMASPACAFTAFEDDAWNGPQLLSFAGGLFVREEAIAGYLESPRPALVATLLATILDGGHPLLTLEEIRRANSGAGLNLALFPIPLGRMSWDDAKSAELRRLAPQAFLRSFGGYRLQAIYYEVFTDGVAAYIQAAGYHLLHDFSGDPVARALGPDCRPRMLRLTRAELPPAAMSVAAQVFDSPPAQLGLTLAEQRVALREVAPVAVLVEPDAEVTEHVGLDAAAAVGRLRVLARDAHQFDERGVQVAREPLEVAHRAEMRLQDALRLVGHQPVDGGVQRVGIELHRRRGRQHERAALRVQRAVTDAEVVAAVDVTVVEVDRAVMVPCVTGGVDELEGAAPEREPLPILDHQHAFGGDRDQFSVQLAVQGLAVDRDRARDQPGRIDQVRGTTRVQHRPCVRERLHHLAGTTGMIEVHVGEEQVVHLLARDPEFVQRGQQPRGSRRRPRVDEGGMALVDHQVARREAGAQVQRVDQVHALAERLRERRVVAGAGAGAGSHP